MLIPRVAHRFAKSLLELSVETDVEDIVYKDALLVSKACNDARELVVMFQSPVVKSDQKLRIFNEIFTDQISDLSKRFFNLIIRKNREELIREISKSFIEQYKDFKNIHSVHVETAAPLSATNKMKVLEYLAKKTDEEIELIEEIDETLIGGIIVRLKDVQIDASIKNNLSKMDRMFSQDMYSSKL